MRILISPAKKMREDLDGFAPEGLPCFLAEAERLKQLLQSMPPKELKSLWKCNDAIAALNIERLADMDLRSRLTPAILSYEGIQYRYMAPGVFTAGQLDYIREHLRILSGFYGLLRPFDGVRPYRLEMQAKLPVDGHPNLYDFWGSKLADVLTGECRWVLNLASKEYSRAVAPHLPPTLPMVTCVFGSEEKGRVVEKGTLCKMARGEMVRWLAENQVTQPEQLTQFDQLDYRFSPVHSTQTEFVFLQIQTGGD